MTDSIDEQMHGMGEPADYDDAPEPEDRLADLVAQLADYAGLTIAPDAAASAPRSGQPIHVSVRCGACDTTHATVVVAYPGQIVTVPDVHLCGADLGDGKHSLFSFTITAGS